MDIPTLTQPIEVKSRGFLESLRLTFETKQPQRPLNRRPIEKGPLSSLWSLAACTEWWCRLAPPQEISFLHWRTAKVCLSFPYLDSRFQRGHSSFGAPVRLTFTYPIPALPSFFFPSLSLLNRRAQTFLSHNCGIFTDRGVITNFHVSSTVNELLYEAFLYPSRDKTPRKIEIVLYYVELS